MLGGQSAEHLQVDLERVKQDLQSVTEQKNKLSDSKQVLKKVGSCVHVFFLWPLPLSLEYVLSQT